MGEYAAGDAEVTAAKMIQKKTQSVLDRTLRKMAGIALRKTTEKIL